MHWLVRKYTPCQLRHVRLCTLLKSVSGTRCGQHLTQAAACRDVVLLCLQGYVRLYAGITQSANPGNPHGLPHAWAFLARCGTCQSTDVNSYATGHSPPVLCVTLCCTCGPLAVAECTGHRLMASAPKAFLR